MQRLAPTCHSYRHFLLKSFGDGLFAFCSVNISENASGNEFYIYMAEACGFNFILVDAASNLLIKPSQTFICISSPK